MDDQLSEHFTWREVERSDTARRHGIDNTVPEDLRDNVRSAVEMMEKIRAHLWRTAGFEIPITISSWYRSSAVERIVSHKEYGDHMKGGAIDWKAPKFGPPSIIAAELSEHVDELGIGQLINEYPGPGDEGWIHTSIFTPAKVINRIITVDYNTAGKVETRAGVLASFA